MSFKTEFKRVKKQMYKISADRGFHDNDVSLEAASLGSSPLDAIYNAQVTPTADADC